MELKIKIMSKCSWPQKGGLTVTLALHNGNSIGSVATVPLIAMVVKFGRKGLKRKHSNFEGNISRKMSIKKTQKAHSNRISIHYCKHLHPLPTWL